MKTGVLETPAKRVSIAVAVVAAMILLGAVVYLFLGGSPPRVVNGPRIVAAAHAYSIALRQRHAPIPNAVPLQVLIDQGFLKSADIGSLQGMDVQIFLVAPPSGPSVLMKVQMPDGTDMVLLTDGTMEQVKR